MGLRMALAVVAALVLPATAWAQVAPSGRGRAALAQFNRLDRDGDHALDRAELYAAGRGKGASALFDLLDADGDGRISLKELGAASGALLARFDALDANHDGFVARSEFPARMDVRLVAALDRDHDGRLSLAELRPAFAGARPSRARDAIMAKPAAKPAPAQERAAAPSCWVTGFGPHRWNLEAPVVWGACRSR